MNDLRKQQALVVCCGGRLSADFSNKILEIARGSTVVSCFLSNLFVDFIQKRNDIVGFNYNGMAYDLLIVQAELFHCIPYSLM